MSKSGSNESKNPAEVPLLNRAAFETSWNLDDYYGTAEDFEPHERQLVEEYFPPAPARVLDLGCGGGRTTIPLERLGYSVIAADLSWTLLLRAKQRLGSVPLLFMDAAFLALREHAFDAVLFSFNGLDGLFPVALRISCIREVFRVLRPGGIFQMSTHNLLGLVFWRGRISRELLRILCDQRFSRTKGSWYIRYEDGGGPQFLFSAPPGRTKSQLSSAGFELLDVRGSCGEKSRWKIPFMEHHVNFVVRKPS